MSYCIGCKLKWPTLSLDVVPYLEKRNIARRYCEEEKVIHVTHLQWLPDGEIRDAFLVTLATGGPDAAQAILDEWERRRTT